jgi:hypothetical protein
VASPSILRIERMNYVLGGVLAVAALITQARDIALGVAVGAALTCANFYVLRRLVTKWTAEAAAGKGGNSAVLMLPKMVALMAAVAVAVLLLPIDVIAFTVGYSIFIVSIVADTIYSGMRTENGHDHG